MLPVAPGANGQPPSPPRDASKLRTPALSAAVTLACHRPGADRAPDRAHQSLDLGWIGITDRIGDDDLVRARARELLGDLHDAFFGNGAGDRAAVGGRNPCSDRYLSLVSLGDLVAQANDAHEVVQRLLGAAAHVGLIVRLADRKSVV